MKLFLTLMAGDTVVDAEPIFASSNPSLIDAVIGRLDLMVDDAARDAREESDENEVQGIPATPRPDAAAEVERLARGWRRGWIAIQRLKRRAEGSPPMEIEKD